MLVVSLLLALSMPGGEGGRKAAIKPLQESDGLAAPLKTEQRGRKSVRTYVLKPGQSFETPRGIRTWVRRIEGDGVIMSRWKEPLSPKAQLGYSTGSRESLHVLSVDAKAQTVRFEVHTKTSLAWWEVMAF